MEVLEYRPEAAHQRYILKDGSEVRGASSIAKVDDDNFRLMRWANNLGLQGVNCFKKRDMAGDAGSVAHFMIHCHFKDMEPGLKKMSQEACEIGARVFKRFMEWWEDNELTCIATEIELVSEKYRYGGTTDLVATDPKNRIWVIDLKTSSGIWLGHKSQIVGLGKLWEEHNDTEVYKHVIVRLPREGGRPEIVTIHNHEDFFELFLAQLLVTEKKYKVGGYQ